MLRLTIQIFIAIVTLTLTLAIWRLNSIIRENRARPWKRTRQRTSQVIRDHDHSQSNLSLLTSLAWDTAPKCLLVVMGSGGHSTEMFYMLQRVLRDETSDGFLTSFELRRYVIGVDDLFSENLVRDLERQIALTPSRSSTPSGETPLQTSLYDICYVPRARKVHQSVWSTPFSCLRCLRACLRVLDLRSSPPRCPNPPISPTIWQNPYSRYPNLVLMNGPGTACIMAFACLILRFFHLHRANHPNYLRCVYVESWARVRSLSLTGRLLCRFADRFLVQWCDLLPSTRGRGEFCGPLI